MQLAFDPEDYKYILDINPLTFTEDCPDDIKKKIEKQVKDFNKAYDKFYKRSEFDFVDELDIDDI